MLALLGQSGPPDHGVTDDEVRLVLSEARSAGILEQTETELVAGVTRIADRTASGLMIPWHGVEVVNLADGPAAAARRFRETGHSRRPVRDDGPDDIKRPVFLRRAILRLAFLYGTGVHYDKAVV